ncbi:protein of unknown function [Pseudomonas sp. JV551A1]|uniref:Uncharacterized protein n=1 Tax=Pseudomonas inefficax TaxID=2078786 RepID=A0AAQ1PAF9_9PSED|nr:protein of unknown function [Pseudomonas sp. JV551A1]SPO62132.1 protein of unknown function [Pseudomonas inefficax]
MMCSVLRSLGRIAPLKKLNVLEIHPCPIANKAPSNGSMMRKATASSPQQAAATTCSFTSRPSNPTASRA